jgi:Fe-S cluster assembly ATP-binding protein
MEKLTINNIHITVDAKEIVRGVSFDVPRGKVVALMGPNGSGKSTLVNALAGHPRFLITAGSVTLDGKDITVLSASEKARAGLFLSPQNPPEIPGVSIFSFLRSAYNLKKEQPLSVPEFNTLLTSEAEALGIENTFLKRSLNEGFSGGEKKRMEALQLVLLGPRYALLDETDSGLDVDALQCIASSIAGKKQDRGIVVITHYTHILKYLPPDKVHIMQEGRIVQSGGAELAEEIERNGYQERET